MKTLPTWAGKSQFKYTGSVKQGTSIFYGKDFRYSQTVSASQYDALLHHFRGQTVDIGTSRDNAPRGSVGEWVQSNVTMTATASYIGPILIEEGCAEKVSRTQIAFYDVSIPTLLLRFRIDLKDRSLSPSSPHNGPIFHRWLPDGEKDAINLEVEDPKVKFKIWFERCGYTAGEFIRFDAKRREIDPNVMSKQGCLDAGPLIGLMEIMGLPEETLIAVQENRAGDDKYKELAKRIVKQLAYPSISKVMDVIRLGYGQYWVPELRHWDSRNHSLGYYCSHMLGMRWSLDGGKTWSHFDPDEPDEPKAKFIARPRPDFGEYLNEEAWKELVHQTKAMPSVVSVFLSRSHQFCDEGDLRYAFIEGVTALELAIYDFMRNRMSSDYIRESGKAFRTLPLRAKLTVITTTLGSLPVDQVERALKAIEYRNDIVHKGRNPPDNSKTELYGLLTTITSLYPEAKFKFPSIRISKTSAPEEYWESQQKN